MQRIKNSTPTPIPFTTVAASNVQTRLDASTLTFTVRVVKANGASVAGGGAITQPDVANAIGCCFYTPSAGDLNVNGPGIVRISGTGVANMETRELDFDVTPLDPYDVVRAGMTALPNALPGAAGGLPTLGTGAGQINVDGAGAVDGNLKKWKGTTPNDLTANRVDVTVGAVQNNAITLASISVAALAGIAQQVWSALIASNASAGSVGEVIRIVMSLLLGNYAQDNITQDAAGLVTTSRIICFPDAATAQAAVNGAGLGTQGEFAALQIQTTTSAPGVPTLLRGWRIL